MVEAAPSHEGGVSALLDDPPLVQDENAVGPLHGRQAVGDQDGGPSSHQPVQRLLHQHLRLRIQGRGRFVQDQEPGIFQERPGDGESLPLSPRQIDTFFAHHGLISVGQRGDEAMGIARPAGRKGLFQGRVSTAVANVLENRPAKQDGFLGHERNLPVQAGQADVAQVIAVNGHGSRGRIVEAM